MDETEFFETVAQRGDLESTEAARGATDATLRAFGEHVSRGQAENVADELPDGLAEAMTDLSTEHPEEITLDAFVAQVAAAEDADEATAAEHVRAVMSVLAETVGHDELRDARSQLPNEFDSLFEPPGEETGTSDD